MRLLACLLLLSAAAPAAAAETIADQAQRAYAFYAGGLSQQAFLTAQYGSALLANIAGNWVRLNGPDAKSGAETYGTDTEKFCKTQAALSLSSANPLTLSLTTNLKGANFSQQYVLIAGATFGEYTDPTAYLSAVGIGPDKVGANFDQQRALLLSLANGIVQIYRPSEDILVMTRDRGYPIVLARCPVAPPVAPADASSSSSSSAVQ
jgi:hypothetical protein